jgi:hypothetical protein
VNRSKQKPACYFCGGPGEASREHIPGKLFGVVDGLILPACKPCNKSWEKDQQFVRLRIVLHAGSQPSARYMKDRELLRVHGSAEKRPQVGRYKRERDKTFAVSGVEYMGLTDDDYSRLQNVVTRWAAGLHYAHRGVPAGAPEEFMDTVAWPRLDPKKLTARLMSQPHIWHTKTGEFALWWFVPGPEPRQSAVVIQLLGVDTLWFVVRFSANASASSASQQASSGSRSSSSRVQSPVMATSFWRFNLSLLRSAVSEFYGAKDTVFSMVAGLPSIAGFASPELARWLEVHWRGSRWSAALPIIALGAYRVARVNYESHRKLEEQRDELLAKDAPRLLIGFDAAPTLKGVVTDRPVFLENRGEDAYDVQVETIKLRTGIAEFPVLPVLKHDNKAPVTARIVESSERRITSGPHDFEYLLENEWLTTFIHPLLLEPPSPEVLKSAERRRGRGEQPQPGARHQESGLRGAVTGRMPVQNKGNLCL